jgi:VanZ family protein
MSRQERRAIGMSLAFWCLFIIYGSFIPFRFSIDPAFVHENLAKVQLYPFRDGRRNFSILDVASNVLLFFPFGFLAATSGRPPSSSRRWALRITIVGFSATAFATVIEGGQLFTTERTCSVLDVAANVSGAIVGAGAVWMFSRRFYPA